MESNLSGKVIIITGSSSGIGKALAKKCLEHNANVVISARNTENLSLAEQELKSISENIIAIPCDVSKEEDCKMLIERTITQFGKIDILTNNAGISMRALFEEVELSVIKKVMDINFWGTVYCSKYALPYLLNSNGSIIGISSIAGYKGIPARTGYSASKFAMQGFLESLRIENLKKGLHVMVVAPGFTASNIRNTALSKDGSLQGETPLDEAEIMSAEKVAIHIINGVKKRKRDIILTSQGKWTVFLNKWFPFWMDKLVYNHFAREKNSPIK